MSLQKAMTLIAKYQALTNASEFIRSHGEEGFSFEDEKFNEIYLRETEKLSKKLQKLSEKYLKQYEDIGIEVNLEVNGY
jgi:hypothetical protein